MKHTPERHRDSADRAVKDIRRNTRKRYSSEDKIRIVLAGLRGEDTIAKIHFGRKSIKALALKYEFDMDVGLQELQLIGWSDWLLVQSHSRK